MNVDKTFLVIVEKPSVSLAIAQVLGKHEKMNGYVQGTDLSATGGWDIWQSMRFRKSMIPGTGTGSWQTCRLSRRNGTNITIQSIMTRLSIPVGTVYPEPAGIFLLEEIKEGWQKLTK